MTIPLRMGMIGGGKDAFIGSVHRIAAAIDNSATLVAGCLSSTPEKAIASGKTLDLAADRNYPTWSAMLDAESRRPRHERIDFVSIVTPNHTHFEIARAFAAAGFHIVCDKPLCHTSEQATELVRLTEEKKIVFAVTYNYSGYPMVKEARDLVRRGELGHLRKVVVEYNQGWLANRLESTGQKQADWRTDPARSGLGGAIGDIGSHAEQLTSYITGLELDAICADLTAFVPGRKLDDDANVLLRFRASRPLPEGGGRGEGSPSPFPSSPPPPRSSPAPSGGGVTRGSASVTEGARGVLIASQISIGHENDLRIRVHGSKASLSWQQENPNHLVVSRDGQPDQVYRRGNGYLTGAAKSHTRIPAGHPEAFLEAFANIYRNATNAIRAGKGGLAAATEFDFPSVHDGARGVTFIEKVVESAASERKWTRIALT